MLEAGCHTSKVAGFPLGYQDARERRNSGRRQGEQTRPRDGHETVAGERRRTGQAGERAERWQDRAPAADYETGQALRLVRRTL